MKRAVAAAVVIATMIVVTLLVLRSGPHPSPGTYPQLDALLARCDASGSSLAVAYDKVSEQMPHYLTLDRHTALAAARGQIANVIDGRLSTCEQALAVATHDGRSSAAAAVPAFLDRLKAARAALDALETSLSAGSDDAAAKLAALTAAVH